MSVSVSKAKSEDIAFMAEQILAGAREGHFDPRLADAGGQILIQNDVRSVVERNRRFDDADLTAQAFIFREGGDVVGFAVVSDTPPQLAGKELYAYYIVPEHRRKGHGKDLLERLKGRVFSKGDGLFVRCLPNSQSMYELLEGAGFVCVGHNELGARIMHHPPKRAPAESVDQKGNRG